MAKVRLSGGGRCNVTHHGFVPEEFSSRYPRGRRVLIGAFHRFQARDTVECFRARAVCLKVEADGRMFPLTDSSETIAGCPMDATRNARVRLLTGRRVSELESMTTGGFRFQSAWTTGWIASRSMAVS